MNTKNKKQAAVGKTNGKLVIKNNTSKKTAIKTKKPDSGKEEEDEDFLESLDTEFPLSGGETDE